MRYTNNNGISYRQDSKSGEEMMANFTARIVSETDYIGGVSPEKTLTIEGEALNKEGGEAIKLPPIVISDSEFAGMAWPLKHWGVRCVILPGSGIKEDLRTSIQLLSQPSKVSIYRQTGYMTLPDGTPGYIHRGGAITAKGNRADVSVQLPVELRYDITPRPDPRACVLSTLALTQMTKPDLTWPLLAATLAPLYGPCDFAIHVTGRTGSFKSEVMSLFQSHYGSEMDARHLPGSWSSSDNALEAMAFLACNAAFTIDDFVPHGSAWQQRAYQGKAERIFRAQGNQSGRQRLTDVSSVQQTMYPRGCVLSTGEDTPEGHSVRGRMLIREIQPGDVTVDKLSAAQANRQLYPGTVAWLVQDILARPEDITARAAAIRDEYRDVGHSRTPSTLGRMMAVVENALARFRAAGFINKKQEGQLFSQAANAITQAGSEQQGFLEATDPVDVFFNTMKQTWAAGTSHIRSVSGGVPKHAEQLGWTAEVSSADSIKQYKARGQCVGWVSAKRDELYLQPDLAVALAKKVSGAEIPLSKATLMKRIAESGKLARRDATRERYTVRVKCEDATREVLVLRLSDVLDSVKEVVDEE